MPIEKKRQREKKFNNEQMKVEKYGGGLGYGNSNSGNKKINIPGTNGRKNNGTDSRSARIDQLDMRKREPAASKTTSMSWSDFANASKNVERKRKEDAVAKERAAARRNHQEETGIDAAARKRSNLKAEMKAVGEYHRNMDQLTRQTVRGNAQQRDKATKARQAYENAFKQEHSNIDQKKLERKKMIQNKKGGR